MLTGKSTLKPEPRQFSIGTLAEAAGVTRRVVRFYVQRGLLPPPLGRGRGSHYNETHLNRLLEIQQRQARGESLDAIQTAVGQQAENAHKNGQEKRQADGTAASEKHELQINALSLDELPSSPATTKPKSNAAPRHVRNRARAKLAVSQWHRLELAPGVELNINTSQHPASADAIALIQQRLREEWRGIQQEISKQKQ